jgi:hypothetical protein
MRGLRSSGVLAALMLAACGGGGDGGIITVPPTPVTISMAPSTATVTVGASTSFAVSISGGSPTPTLASCTSSSSGTATASVNGSSCSATGVSAGTATITATSTGGQSASALLTVAAPLPALTGMTLTPPTAALTVGQTVTLTATPVAQQGVTASVSYSSSSPAVASVSSAGVVTAVGAGSATITATAQGSGAGFAATTLTRTSTITVTVDPCAPIAITLPVARSGSIGPTNCVISSTVQRRGYVLRVNLASAAAVEVSLVPTGFSPYITMFPVGETEFIFSSQQSATEVRRIWHLAAGPTEVRAGTLNAGESGTYTLQAQAVSASVGGCRAVIVAGSVTSNQTLEPTDCVTDSRFGDEFLVYSSRPCVITMRRGTTGTPMTDPFLEVFAGADSLVFDDDSGGNFDARVSLASCRSPADNVLTLRATSFGTNDPGTYTMTVQFGSAAVVENTVQAPSARAKGERTVTQFGSAESVNRTWLEHLGIETITPRQDASR